MVRLRLAVIECNYKEIDKQLKEQYMHALNDTAMFEETIRELTKTEEGPNLTSEWVLVWAKRVEPQKTQFTIITSLNETKDFDNK